MTKGKPVSESLKGLIETVSRAVGSRFDETGVMTPHWFAVTESGETFLIPSPPVDKDLAVLLIRKYFRLRGVVAYVFFDEAWVIEGTMDEKEKMAKFAEGNSLEKYPGRREVMLFSAEDGDGSFLARRPIIRPEGGKPYLGELEMDLYRGLEGRLVNILGRD